jgi:ubiquinone/menaquinone biosynthesis C-methylase UbiE
MPDAAALKDRLSDRAFVVLHNRFFPPLQKRIYPLMTRFTAGEVLLLNAGYEEDPPMALPLAPADEPSRWAIQLYHRVATQVDLSGKQVLEVGCGHGGGASYVMRTLGPSSYTGLDLNPAGIALCREKHDLPGIDFVRGDAQNLPFPDQSFDAVINIESSHCYPQFSRFLAEVARVLRPGGHFLYSDSQHPMGISAWEAALANAPLQIVSERLISKEVARGVEKQSQHWLDVVDHRTPAFLHRLIHKIWRPLLLSGCRDLESEAKSYRIYCFAKV